MFLLSSQNLSLSLNTSFLHLSRTKKNHIIQLCRSKLIPTMNYCSSLLRSAPSWLKQKKFDPKHRTALLNNTLQNNQKSPLTNLTMILHQELFVITFTNLIHTNSIVRILHSPHSHTFSNATITPLKFLQSLDIDSKRITQSSKAIQTTLESVNIVFRSSNHI